MLAQKCGHLQFNYEDEQFLSSFPACYKILRYWTIIDWCNYDVNNPEAGGRFNHVQVLKVMDQTAPEIQCVSDTITGSIDENCEFASVNIPLVTATDCSTDIQIINDSPFADNNGADASGTYPLGETIVTFTATDPCGNRTQCQIVVEVKDNTPPSPICIVGLSVNLMEVEGEFLASIDASAFNRKSTDNCTDSEDLVFTIREEETTTGEKVAPQTPMLVFDCSDVGTKIIEFWATDQAGNSDYCQTFITIQDLSGNCTPETIGGMVAGGVFTEMGEEVEEVKVVAYGVEPFEVMTNELGQFELDGMPIGSDYTLVPEKDGLASNGLSTMDMILISQHILGLRSLGSPYKIIAADLDRSNSITTLDLIKLRKLILRIDLEMPGGGKPWRFVDANYVFKDAANPFANRFPEVYNVNDYEGEEVLADFIAIKIGDVNGSAVPNRNSTVEPRSQLSALEIFTEKTTVKKDETISVDFKVSPKDIIMGYQIYP